jgi:diaminohydroxyphosphoribosylaminopyrimidine deaminase/5-amino-6-(5-phosphoribosylamino)uracil reductase
VVVDSRLEISPHARVLGPGTLIAAAREDDSRIAVLRERGAEVVVLPNASGKVDLAALVAELARRGMNEVHIEAGHKLNASLLQDNLVDELIVYLAPRILGDTARGMFHLPELTDLAQSRGFELRDVRTIGGDARVIARAKAL